LLAKIFIKRKFLREGIEAVPELLNRMRAAAMRNQGYISGETLMSAHNPYHVVVIASWQSMEDWMRWKQSAERQKIEAQLEVFQLGPTEYEEFVVGSAFPRE